MLLTALHSNLGVHVVKRLERDAVIRDYLHGAPAYAGAFPGLDARLRDLVSSISARVAAEAAIASLAE